MEGEVPAEVFEKVMEHCLSDSMVDEIEGFARKHCAAFSLEDGSAGSEQKLEYMELYNEMKALFENKLAAFIESCGVTMEQFESMCEKVITSTDEAMAEKKSSLSFLGMITDYSTFVQMMQECRREADEGMALP